jgi:capsular polysaccharide biosynthesis protein
VVISVGVATGVAWLLTSNQVPIYRSSARVLVGPSERITNAREVMEVFNTLDRRSVVATLSKLALSEPVAGAVVSEIPDARNYETNCVVVPDTNILEITATGRNAETAAAVANATARHMIPFAADMYDSFQLKMLDSGEARIARPFLPRNLAAGAGFGLIAGLLLAYLAALLSARRGRRREVEDSSENISSLSPEAGVGGSHRL